MSKTLSVHEALIHVMVTTFVADRTVSDAEIAQVETLIRRLPVFADFAGAVGPIAAACTAELDHADGIDRILDKVAAALPPRLHETAYALAVEVAAVDLSLPQAELQFLQLLEDRLELPKLAVAAIEHSARVRYRLAS